MRDVLDAYGPYKQRQAREHWGDDPPGIVVQGVVAYDAAIERIRAHDIDRENKQRKRDAEAARQKSRHQ